MGRPFRPLCLLSLFTLSHQMSSAHPPLKWNLRQRRSRRLCFYSQIEFSRSQITSVWIELRTRCLEAPGRPGSTALQKVLLTTHTLTHAHTHTRTHAHTDTRTHSHTHTHLHTHTHAHTHTHTRTHTYTYTHTQTHTHTHTHTRTQPCFHSPYLCSCLLDAGLNAGQCFRSML